jgi:hypothetical protein
LKKKKEEGKKSMFAYLITVKENRKKKRGAIRTNDLCIFSPSSSLACGLERERERKKVDEQIKHVAAVTSHSSFQIVLLIISCSSTFFNKQRTGEKKIHSSKK